MQLMESWGTARVLTRLLCLVACLLSIPVCFIFGEDQSFFLTCIKQYTSQKMTPTSWLRSLCRDTGYHGSTIKRPSCGWEAYGNMVRSNFISTISELKRECLNPHT